MSWSTARSIVARAGEVTPPGADAAQDQDAAGIAQRVSAVRERLEQACRRAGRFPGDVTLIAVSKSASAPAMAEAYRAGVRHFGENRVQEAHRKIAALAPGLNPRPTWHLVGRLQFNKVKPALALFDIIHSVDSLRLAQAISSRAERPLPILLEVNVAGEATKGGFTLDGAAASFPQIRALPNLDVRGLMTIAPARATPEARRQVFGALRALRERLGLEHLSMGMSDDFAIAIEEGATMVRVGRAIFGERRG